MTENSNHIYRTNYIFDQLQKKKFSVKTTLQKLTTLSLMSKNTLLTRNKK